MDDAVHKIMIWRAASSKTVAPLVPTFLLVLSTGSAAQCWLTLHVDLLTVGRIKLIVGVDLLISIKRLRKCRLALDVKILIVARVSLHVDLLIFILRRGHIAIDLSSKAPIISVVTRAEISQKSLPEPTPGSQCRLRPDRLVAVGSCICFCGLPCCGDPSLHRVLAARPASECNLLGDLLWI